MDRKVIDIRRFDDRQLYPESFRDKFGECYVCTRRAGVYLVTTLDPDEHPGCWYTPYCEACMPQQWLIQWALAKL